MKVSEVESSLAYSPSSIISIFSNSINNDATKKMFTIKGIYIAGRGINYSGVYYDSLKDEHTDASITLVVPVVIRSFLASQKTIECIAYLTKRVQTIGAKVELLINVVEVLSQQESIYTDNQLRCFELLQKKAALGYRDVESFIKAKIVARESISVTILIGKGSVIDSDIKHELQEAISCFHFNFVRINLTAEEEIIAALEDYGTSSNIVVVSRGGGEKL